MTPRRWILAASLFLLVSLVVGALVGPIHIGLVDALQSAAARIPFLHVRTSLSPADEAILWDIRIPRVVLGALVGAMLATAGASYQGVFRNPLADPYLLGVAAGADVDRPDERSGEHRREQEGQRPCQPEPRQSANPEPAPLGERRLDQRKLGRLRH